MRTGCQTPDNQITKWSLSICYLCLNLLLNHALFNSHPTHTHCHVCHALTIHDRHCCGSQQHVASRQEKSEGSFLQRKTRYFQSKTCLQLKYISQLSIYKIRNSKTFVIQSICTVFYMDTFTTASILQSVCSIVISFYFESAEQETCVVPRAALRQLLYCSRCLWSAASWNIPTESSPPLLLRLVEPGAGGLRHSRPGVRKIMWASRVSGCRWSCWQSYYIPSSCE